MVFRVQEATHLFWGKYPYKALVALPLKLKDYKSAGPYFVACRQAAKTLKLDGGEHKQRIETNKVSLFFVSEASFEFFIEHNKDLITEVCRPASTVAMSAMLDRKIRVRPSLFFRKFRWKITMSAAYLRADEANAPVDSWIEEYFDFDRPPPVKTKHGFVKTESVSTDRFHYNYHNARVIYVNSVSDAVAVKIGLSDYITDVAECVLKTELPTNISHLE